MREPTFPRRLPRLQAPERHQIKLRTASLDALVSADHSVRNVWHYVELAKLDELYDAIRAVEGAPGRPPIHPKILLALWLYATLEGVGSARELERLTREHQVYQWICGDVSVNHHTLSDFRVGHPELLERLLVEGVSALTSRGLVTMDRVAQDGVRVRASAGAGSFHREKTLSTYVAEAEEQLRKLADELQADPQASNRRRRAARERAAREMKERVADAMRQLPEIREIKARAKTQKKRDQEPRVSSTDPDARKMKMANGGYNPALNVQYATDVDTQIIVGVDVTNIGTDAGRMPPMVTQLIKDYGRAPGAILVDGGIAVPCAIDEVATIAPGCTVYGPLPESKDSERDPTQPVKGDSSAVAAWRARMGTELGKSIYKLRAQTAECINAIARNRGLLRFVVRGIKKAKSIALWYALAHNVNRIPAIVKPQTS